MKRVIPMSFNSKALYQKNKQIFFSNLVLLDLIDLFRQKKGVATIATVRKLKEIIRALFISILIRFRAF